MSDFVTFFRNRKKDGGETYRITAGSTDFYVYSRGPVTAPLPQDSSQRDVVDATRRQIVNAVRPQGGVLVTVVESAKGATVSIEQLGTASPAPLRCLTLLAGRLVAADFDKPVSVPLGSHLIVPVNDDAAEHLEQFIGQLDYLSLDLQALVLHSIQYPGLDARVKKIEDQLSGRGAENRAAWWQKPMMVRSALVTFVVGAFAATWIIVKTCSQEPPVSSTETATQTTATTRTETGTSTSTTQTASPETQAAKDLVTKLGAKTDSDLKNIYKFHFGPLVAKNQLDDEIAALYTPAGAMTGDRQRFLWGLLKLQTLSLTPLDRTFANSERTYRLTRRQLAQKTVSEKRSTDEIGESFLKALACRLSTETEASPELTGTSPTDDPIVFDGKCDITSAQIASGLRNLDTWLDTQK